MSRFKLGNDYVDNAIPRNAYAETPKAVWAAIAYSLAVRLAELDPGAPYVMEVIASEWQSLYDNRIVPQRPI